MAFTILCFLNRRLQQNQLSAADTNGSQYYPNYLQYDSCTYVEYIMLISDPLINK